MTVARFCLGLWHVSHFSQHSGICSLSSVWSFVYKWKLISEHFLFLVALGNAVHNIFRLFGLLCLFVMVVYFCLTK